MYAMNKQRGAGFSASGVLFFVASASALCCHIVYNIPRSDLVLSGSLVKHVQGASPQALLRRSASFAGFSAGGGGIPD